MGMGIRTIKIWLAREEDIPTEEDAIGRQPVKIFYDSPIRVSLGSRWEWGGARQIGSAKPYMYPEIGPGGTAELTLDMLWPV